MFGGWPLTLAITALVMLVLFRRARRLFGRQKFSLIRLGVRVGIISGVCVLLIVVISAVRGLTPLLGLLIGTAIGLVGLYLTRFDRTDGEIYFTPNPYVGSAVLSLFLGRMIYRFIAIRALNGAAQTGDSPLESMRNSPTSSLILFVVLGFYVCFYVSLMIRGRIFSEGAAEA